MTSRNALVAALPPTFMTTPYVYDLGPDADPGLGLAAGANCQRFAYSVLAHFGLTVPAHRSSELWADETTMITVAEPAALDLVLYGRTTDAFGAHVGVCVGDDLVLHLCQEIGVPVLWINADFEGRERYATRIGFKRVGSRRSARLGLRFS